MTERKAVPLDRDLEAHRRQALQNGKPFCVCLQGKVTVQPGPVSFHPSLAAAEADRDRCAASDTWKVHSAHIEQYQDGRWQKVPDSRRFGKLELHPADE